MSGAGEVVAAWDGQARVGRRYYGDQTSFGEMPSAVAENGAG